MLRDKVFSSVGRAISWTLIVTTQVVTANIAYAQNKFDQAVAEANAYARELTQNRTMPHITANGDVVVGGEVLVSSQEITGQRDNDYLPANTDTFGNDGQTLFQGQSAQNRYEEKTLETAETSGEISYHLVKNSFARQKPDLSNDPVWQNTDNILENVSEIAKGFANCEIKKELIGNGKEYHVPKYETCEKLPAIEDSFQIFHDYEVGVIKHRSGPLNMRSCGDGCMRIWIGTVGDNYWAGWCTIYEESMSIEVIQPDAILYARLDRSVFDDYHQVWLNNTKVYNGPNANFPPETAGACELSTSWNLRPNVNITNSFRSVAPKGELKFKTRTSVAGNGEGYSELLVNYDHKRIVYNDVWTTVDRIKDALDIKKQIDDGYCTGSIRCTNMPSLDANGCTTMNGIYVCEDDFANNELKDLGISPFCRRVDVVSDCDFNEGQVCFEDMNGVEKCYDNSTVDRNQCQEYEQNPECSYVKTECVEGAEGGSGICYVQEDTYDCGFTVNSGTETEEEVLRCDGAIQCIGESCYSPTRDAPNGSFGEVNAYLEMLKYAKSDMNCQGIPDRPYDEQNPPDRYYPITTCQEGYTYNVEKKICLKPTRCDYSDNDFYAASMRDGIQVLKTGRVVAENASIGQCVPIIEGDTAYTCGDAQQRLGTDTFYSVCTNSTAAANPRGCPSEGHVLNETNGLCEVAPIAKCEDGYDLIEGDDPFSREDDVCQSQMFAVDKTCQDGYTLKGDKCEKSVTYPITKSCPSGYSLVGDQCKKSVTTSITYSCPSGYSRNGDNCQKESIEHGYDTHAQRTTYNARAGGSGNSGARGVCWKGVCERSINKILNDWTYVPKLGAYFKVGTFVYSDYYSQYYTIYRKTILTASLNSSCSSGYYLDGSVCRKDSYTAYTPTCPSGYYLNGSICQKETYEAYVPVCPDGFNLTPDGESCLKDPETMQPEYSCPSHYPNWNEEEKRCVADKYFDLANQKTIPAFKANPTEQPSNVQMKHLMDTVLAPFELLFSTAVPSVVANDDMHNSEQSRETQERMNDYIAGKFGDMAERMANDNELYATGQAQLAGLAAPMSMSSVSPAQSSASSGQNVICELFKGEAMECKIAVGGMQDCCKNPVAVSLGDYIKLSRTMIQMDAYTGQVFGLDGYSGVWEMGKEWAGDAASSAWDAVSGLWSSTADAAAGTATSTAGEQAGGNLMAAFGQQVMQYTNQFLIDTFGEEVAKLFFQEVTKGGTTQVAASAGMQAVGTALMYVYYAYLAYVVFNLLVNIIYECTEEEMDLAMKKDLFSTHYLGSYCKSKVLGACIERREVHCSFSSPLSRIVMEQIYAQPQMGLSWGTPKNPNCTGIEIGDLEKVDWDKVDLDEWIGMLIKTDNLKSMGDINLDALTGSGSALQDGQGRLDTLERNKQRFEDVDVDQMRRDGYEDGWNRMQ